MDLLPFAPRRADARQSTVVRPALGDIALYPEVESGRCKVAPVPPATVLLRLLSLADSDKATRVLHA